MSVTVTRNAVRAFPQLAIALAVSSVFPHLAHAQAASDASLEPVFVTATRSAQKAGDVIADHVVISAEEIQQSGQTSLVDLLQTQRSVEVIRNGGAGNSASVAIRGGTNKQTLLLVDGVRTVSSTSGEPNWSAIPLSQIDRIEIVMGPMTVLYGADAVGGVIQVFTKKGDGAPHVSFSAGAGSHGEQTQTAGVYGSTQGEHAVRYAFNVAHEKARGFSSTNSLNRSYDPDKDGYSKRSASGSLSMDLAKGHEVGVSFLSSRNKGEYDTSSSIPNPHQVGSVDVYSIYTRNQIMENWTSLFQISRSKDKGRTYTKPEVSVIESSQDRYTWQNDIRLGADLLQIIAEHVREEAETSGIDKSRTNNSLAIAYQMKRGKHIGSAGARYDHSSAYGSEVTGSLGYGYHMTPNWRVNGSVGTSFRAPTFNDLYYPGYGNLDAKPEKGKNAEIGVYYDDGRNDFSAVYYRNKLTDMLVTATPCPSTGIGSCYYNVDEATLSGLSFAGGTHFGNFVLRGTLDLQDPKNKETNKLLARRSRSHGSVSLDYLIGAWKVGGDVYFSGHRYDKDDHKQRLGGYTLLNLHATYDLTDNWQLFGRWNNVTDKDYTMAYGYETAGSNVFVGVRYGFK